MRRSTRRFLFALALGGLAAAPLANAEVVIRAVTFQPPGAALAGYTKFVEMVNREGKGKVRIENAGGPEAIPARDQPEAVRRGSVDMAIVPSSYYKSLVPEALALSISPLSPVAERKSGFHDFLVERHREAGLHYVGRENWGTLFNIWTNKPVKSPKELAGQLLRVGRSPTAFVKSLGAEPVSLPIADIYSAVDRGVVNGFVLPAEFVLDSSLYEVVKFGLSPGFWNRDEVYIMNLKAWEALPQDVRDLISGVQMRLEPELIADSQALMDKTMAALKGKGMQIIEFSAADGKAFVDQAEQVAWQGLEKSIKPEQFARMRDLLKH